MKKSSVASNDKARRQVSKEKTQKHDNPLLMQFLDPSANISRKVSISDQPFYGAEVFQRTTIDIQSDFDGQKCCVKLLAEIDNPIQVQKEGGPGSPQGSALADFDSFEGGIFIPYSQGSAQGFLLPYSEGFAFDNYGGWNQNVNPANICKLRFGNQGAAFPRLLWANGDVVLTDSSGWLPLKDNTSGSVQVTAAFEWDRTLTGDQFKVYQKTLAGTETLLGTSTMAVTQNHWDLSMNITLASAAAIRFELVVSTATVSVRNLLSLTIQIRENAAGVLSSNVEYFQWPDQALMMKNAKAVMFNSCVGDLHDLSNPLVQGGPVATGQRDGRFSAETGDFPHYASVAGNPLYKIHDLPRGARCYWTPAALSDRLFRPIGQVSPLVSTQELIFTFTMAKAGQAYAFTADAIISLITETLALSPYYHKPQKALVEATLDVLNNVVSHGSENDGHVSFYARLSAAWEKLVKISPALVTAAKIAATTIPVILA